jgi:diaminopimelate decarboxylase
LEATELTLRFAAQMKDKYGFNLQELNIGGGFGVRYELDSPSCPIGKFAEAIAATLLKTTDKLALDPPRLVVEPGRGIVAQAGVALYRAGATKDIPGIRKYVFVDGGMADNIRPALYDSKYEAVLAGKINQPDTELVTIAGKFCESGDILIRDIHLPAITENDVIAIPCSGAYSLPMASNYNSSLRPAILMVNNGQSRLIRRRETYEDLSMCDLP